MEKKIGIVFSGFGSQFVGMAKDVYDDYRVVQEYFEEAYNCLNINFVKLCFASSDEELSKVSNAYLSLFLVEAALYSLLTKNGVKPDLVAGYGIGRYAALFVAGGFAFPDGLYLINKYAGFYQEFLDQNKKLSLIEVSGLPLRKMRMLCKDINSDHDQLFISVIKNEASQIIVGSNKIIKKIEQALDKLSLDYKINIQKSLLENGLYCDLMLPVIANFEIYLNKVDFKTLQIPMLSAINGKIVVSSKDVKKELIDQELTTLMWQKVVHELQNCDIVIEVGPGNTLAKDLQNIYPHKNIFTLNNKEDLVKIKNELGISTRDDIGYEE